MNVWTHKIGGIVFRTEFNACLPRRTQNSFEQFLTGDETPNVLHRIRKVSSDTMTLPPLTAAEQRNFLKHSRLSATWLENPILKCPQARSRLNAVGNRPGNTEIWINRDYVSVFDFCRHQLDIFYTNDFVGCVREGQAFTPEYHLSSNFRQIFSTFLPCFSAFLLHSSGVIRGGKAALFLSPNEGGKTTVVGQSNGAPILSGDQIILRKTGDAVVAHGTPLGGITNGSCQAKVGALFVLEKSSHFELKPIYPSELVQCLWTEHQNYTFFLPKQLKKQAFRILSDACHQAPVYRMRFPEDYVDWDAIDAAMVK